MTLAESEAYQEIMEKIEVTPEMRRRILQNLDSAAPRGRVTRLSHWWRYTAAAACAAVALLGALVAPGLLRHGEEPSVQITEEIVACDSLAALEQAVGFPVEGLSQLPFSVSETTWTAYWGELAEIDYAGADGALAVYRKSVGTEDNSGLYEDFDAETTLTVGAQSVTLRGSGGSYTLAVWTDGEYAYSVSLTDGLSAEAWSALLS